MAGAVGVVRCLYLFAELYSKIEGIDSRMDGLRKKSFCKWS